MIVFARSPHRAPAARRVADRVGAPPRRRDALQLAHPEEPDAPAVGRPEHELRAVAAFEPARLERLQVPHPQLAVGLGDRTDNERDHRAIRRYRHTGRIRIQTLARRREHRHARQRCRGDRSRARPRRHRRERDHRGGPEHPPHPRRKTSSRGLHRSGPNGRLLLEIEAHVGNRTQALLRVLLEAAAEHARNRRGHIRRQPLPPGFVLQHARQRLRHIVPLERPRAREHLVENDPEGPDIGASIHRLAARLLGRHVGGGAEHHAELRRVRREGRRMHRIHRPAGDVGRHRLGEPEIEDLHRAIGPHLDVGRLEVPMHDPEFVRGLEAIGDLARDRQRVRERDGTAGNQHREIVPLDQLHHERPKSRRRPGGGNILDAVDLGHVRMVQRRQRLRFTGEPRETIGVRLEQLGEHLQGDVAIEPRVAGPGKPGPFRPGRAWRRLRRGRSGFPGGGSWRRYLSSAGAGCQLPVPSFQLPAITYQ